MSQGKWNENINWDHGGRGLEYPGKDFNLFLIDFQKPCLAHIWGRHDES